MATAAEAAAQAAALKKAIDAKIDEFQQLTQDSAERLDSYASLPYLSWFDFPSITEFEPSKTGLITTDDLPTLTKIQFSEATPSAFAYSPDFSYYVTRVINDIVTGGTGIGTDVQNAIFNQGYERLYQRTRDALDLASARSGARGYRRSQGATRSAQVEILLNFTWQSSDMSREIVKNTAELAQKNIQFAMEKGIDIEKAKADIYIRVAALVLDRFKTLVEAYRIEQTTLVEEYKGELQGILAQVEVGKANSNVEISYQGSLQKAWEVRLNQVTERGKAQIQQAEAANMIKLDAAKNYVTALIGILNPLSSGGLTLTKS